MSNPEINEAERIAVGEEGGVARGERK